MRKRSYSVLVLFRLARVLGMAGLIIWLSRQFIQQVSWTTLLPVIGLYTGYKAFSTTLNIVKFISKVIVAILIICLLII